jgi:nitrite reductase/ring-hydroxylating ferredoxin subunit/uncharacterized membrane protein
MDTMTTAIAEQTWIEPLAEQLGSAVGRLFASGGEVGTRVKDALNGVWLGHPLHPVLTDLPIGAWSAAAIFDALDAERPSAAYRSAAGLCVKVGLVGAAGAAVTGLTDWSDTGGGSRRVGLIHGLLNLTATGCYLASMRARGRRRPEAGRWYAFTGYAIAAFSAYLGGELVYNRQIGVDHSADAEAPEEFTRVMPEADLPADTLHRVMVGETPVLLVRRGRHLYAMAERCAHQGGPLSEGRLEDGTVVCPWHGSRFALDSGEVLNGPSTFAQPCFEARIHDGFVEVRQGR